TLYMLLSCQLVLTPDSFFIFSFTSPATTQLYTLSLHDALPISASIQPIMSLLNSWITSPGWAAARRIRRRSGSDISGPQISSVRSEEHTSELQSRFDLVCRLLLEKKKKTNMKPVHLTIS